MVEEWKTSGRTISKWIESFSIMAGYNRRRKYSRRISWTCISSLCWWIVGYTVLYYRRHRSVNKKPDFIIIIYCENVNFFYAQLWLDICPEVSPHIPEHCPCRLQTKQFHAIIYTLQVSPPLPLHSITLHLTIIHSSLQTMIKHKIAIIYTILQHKSLNKLV